MDAAIDAAAPAHRVGLQAQALQIRREIAHQPVHVGFRSKFEINSIAHQAAFLKQLGAIQISHRNVDPRTDQRKRQGFAGNFAQLAGDAKFMIADLQPIPHLGVELQHHVLIDQRIGAAVKFCQ